jgi:FkbM family methyltransferase
MQRLRVRGIPRLMFATSRFVLGSGLQSVETVSGFKIRIDPSDYFGCMMVYGRFAPEMVALIHRLVRSGDSVIDVGAQLGYITGHLARIVGPEGVCTSFEPDPHALERLGWMVRENKFFWVRIFPLAAGDADGNIPLLLSSTLGWSTAVNGSHLKDLNEITVRVKPIDQLAAAGLIRRPVKFVKVDVEGFECAVIDGMQNLINEDRPAIVLEINPAMLAVRGDDSVRLLNRLACRNYAAYRIREPPGLFQGGRVRLEKIYADSALSSCDVLCFPAERALPDLSDQATTES